MALYKSVYYYYYYYYIYGADSLDFETLAARGRRHLHMRRSQTRVRFDHCLPYLYGCNFYGTTWYSLYSARWNRCRLREPRSRLPAIDSVAVDNINMAARTIGHPSDISHGPRDAWSRGLCVGPTSNINRSNINSNVFLDELTCRSIENIQIGKLQQSFFIS